MSADLTRLLRDWPYEPGKVAARIIPGDDGEPRIQLRLDLGILQMFPDGRPDGLRPEGCESLLEYHEQRLDDHLEEHGSENGFELSPDECKALREEATQYYHRYLCLLALEDFEGVVRDTTRNLRVLDLCRDHAQAEPDRRAMEPYRPYIMMMRARALASQAIRAGEAKAAVFAIDEGLEALRRHYEGIGHPEHFEDSGEARVLRAMRDALVPKLPVSQTAELRRRLERALEQENYELAAILRDELRAAEADPETGTRGG